MNALQCAYPSQAIKARTWSSDQAEGVDSEQGISCILSEQTFAGKIQHNLSQIVYLRYSLDKGRNPQSSRVDHG